MFCNRASSKLVPGSTQPGGVPSGLIVDNLRSNQKVNI